jgi:hypothetical protein
MLRSLLSSATGAINRIFTTISAAIDRAIQLLFAALDRMLSIITSTLRRVLYSIVMPVFDRVERAVLGAITRFEQETIAQIEENRAEHLDALAGAVDRNGSTGDDAGGADTVQTTSPAGMLELIIGIGRSAIENIREIVSFFREKTNAFLAFLIGMITMVVGLIVRTITAEIARVTNAIVSMVARLVQSITSMVSRMIAFIQSLIQRVVTMIEGIVSRVSAFITSPLQRLREFAQNALTSITSAISRFIRRFLGGDTARPEFDNPGPSPIPIPIPIPIPAPPIPDPAPVPAPVPVPELPPWAIIVIIVVIVLIILILIYLLWKWLKKRRKPKKPKGIEYDPQTPFNIEYSVPLENTDIQASAGEKMIFGIESTDKDRMRPIGTAAWTDIDPGTGPYETEYEVSGDAEFDAAGSGAKRHIDPTLRSSNVFLFIESTWGGARITVTGKVKDKALPATPPDTGTTKDAEHTITWTIVPRTNPCPTGLNRTAGPGAVFAPAPVDYTYQATPEINPPGRPNYEHQTVLESFANTKAAGFTMADLTPAWKAANPSQNTPDKVANFLYGVSNNGTFVFDNNDEMSDRHSGFGDTSPFEPAALNRPSGVGYQKDQTYSCASTTIGTALIERNFSTATGIRIRKTGP